MAAITTASAATRTLAGTNISATITSPDTWGADKVTGIYEDVSLTFSFTRTSSTYISNGEFELNLTGIYSPGSVLSVTSPSGGANCTLPGATRAYCTISAAGVDPVIIEVVVKPTSAFITYSWTVRPGTGTDGWLSEANTALTASGDTVAGAVGANAEQVTAETAATDGLKGYLAVTGKSGTGFMFVSVQEFLSMTAQCNDIVPYFVCVKFTAEKSDGNKLVYPYDLAELLSFAVTVNPSLITALQGKSIKSVKLYYFDTANDPNPIQLKGCTKSITRSPPPIPCIADRFSDGVLWTFSLLGSKNGFVQVFD